ncbi:hemolysin family protein [Pengzhenrongella sicca]|uniref:HlyC/CorC family transporter n=1 Tax=Pengzhenrongella sicca TaxID=2819238 RepID=A0A8A4ZC81_9MICO|nr:hemolysin family protein [Pengzhenrongella sicca]QTE28107.1 HlyC/CorC family transporter [Pengzhenrongella sicca]
MNNALIITAVTVALIALSAFFVAVEFALLAAKRHRLEDAAHESRSARAALRSASELTLLLAGSQLGITACTLALGAITKPAVHHWLTPVFETWGVGAVAADVAGFVLALMIVTFLHLVVGEMAPKSWAIAHPETSATLLAIPMRAFMWVTRPVLRALNQMANWTLRKVGVEPADQLATGQSPDDLRHLVEHSVNVGAIDARFSAQVAGALDLQRLSIADLLDEDARPTVVPAAATVAEVQAATRETGHLRVLVGPVGALEGVIHVRDTLTEPAHRPAREFMRPVLSLQAGTPVYAALAAMRETRNHLAVVDDAGAFVGVITLNDVLGRLFPRPADSPV